MITLAQLSRLRGTNPEQSSVPAAQPKTPVTETAENRPQIKEPETNANVATQPQPVDITPVEVPCKNYADEEGHFAYIDAKTHQTIHVNLNSGKKYTQEEINTLSISHAVAPLSDEARQLTWQQVVSESTVYDRFGSPVFTFEEIQSALEKMLQNKFSSTDSAEDKPKLDPWGLPL